MNDEFDSIPSMSVDSDDIKPRQSHHSSDNSHPLTPPKTQNVIQAARGWFFLLIVFLLLLTVSSVLLYTNFQDEKMVLNNAVQRISELENKLTSTDTSINESESLLAIKRKQADEAIKKNSSEVRKLWGVAYDKNRKAIANNTSQNEQQKKILTTLQSQQKQQISSLKKAEENLKKIDSLVKETSQRSVFLQESIEELEKNSAGFSDEQNAVINELKNRLSANEDAIKSIDVHRRNVNDDLRKIKKSLSATNSNSIQ